MVSIIVAQFRSCRKGLRPSLEKTSSIPFVSEIRLRNHLDELPRLQSEIESFAADRRVGREECKTLQLVLEELVTNAIRHGWDDDREHEIVVRLDLENSTEVSIEVEDEGRPFDPTCGSDPISGSSKGEREVGGRGIGLVRRLVTELRYERRGGRNLLAMRTPRGLAPASAGRN